jgi:NAD(P)-dependent dehydrogenase (short-subunit alcohol dehydrogenase family)
MEKSVRRKPPSRWWKQPLKHFGRIDLLVNNAGIFIPKAFTDYTEEDYNLVMNTNVASFFYMTQQVIPQTKSKIRRM